jgi:hypothetical protein
LLNAHAAVFPLFISRFIELRYSRAVARHYDLLAKT